MEGRVYTQIFKVKSFPHVAILNPFTGEIVWRKEGWTPGKQDELNAEVFAEKVVDLPPLDGVAPSVHSSHSAGEKSWELLSLIDSWERLSVGTSEEMDELDGELVETETDEASFVQIDIPSESELSSI